MNKTDFLNKFKGKNKKDKKEQNRKNTIALKGGSYSFGLSLVVLAILVVVNILVNALPTTLTSFDISSTKLYSITSATKAVLNSLEDDVTIYWITQAGEENTVIEKILDKYESLSDHITVEKKNPDVYPTFASEYTDEDVSNNSLIVVSGDNSRYISYDSIYVTEVNYTTYSYDYYFDGEGEITSAIDYVVSEELPQVYVLTGHGEADLPDDLTEQIEKENLETVEFSLLNEDEIPEECDAILIYAPSSDISEEERDILAEYIEEGGKVLVMAGPTEDGTLTTLYGLLEDYGIGTVDGIVVEEDRNYYAFSAPYILLPTIASSDITDSINDNNYYVIMSIAQGMDVSDADSSVTTLLSTSDTSFSKADGYNLTTYEKESGDTDGSFALGVSIENDNEGQLIWYSSSSFLDETYISYSSGANLDLVMNSLSTLVGDTESVSIQSKSIGYTYITISDSTALILKVLMIGILPIAALAIGIVVLIYRRGRRHA